MKKTQVKTNKQQSKINYKAILAQLYAWLSFGCFGIVILQPMWHYNHDTASASLYVLVGWIAAVVSSKMD